MSLSVFIRHIVFVIRYCSTVCAAVGYSIRADRVAELAEARNHLAQFGGVESVIRPLYGQAFATLQAVEYRLLRCIDIGCDRSHILEYLGFKRMPTLEVMKRNKLKLETKLKPKLSKKLLKMRVGIEGGGAKK